MMEEMKNFNLTDEHIEKLKSSGLIINVMPMDDSGWVLWAKYGWFNIIKKIVDVRMKDGSTKKGINFSYQAHGTGYYEAMTLETAENPDLFVKDLTEIFDWVKKEWDEWRKNVENDRNAASGSQTN